MSGKGAVKTGGGTGAQNSANSARASAMKKAPGRYPDSVMKEPGIVRRFAAVPRAHTPQGQFDRGMLGGMLAYLAGYSKINPLEQMRG